MKSQHLSDAMYSFSLGYTALHVILVPRIRIKPARSVVETCELELLDPPGSPSALYFGFYFKWAGKEKKALSV